MTKDEWSDKLKSLCRDAGTYKPFFDEIINQLALILEIRDNAERTYKESGSVPVVEHTNKGGHTNTVKNPSLQILNECNEQALSYWRDLGLTPAGYKKLSGDNMEVKSSFESALAKIGL